MKQQSFLVAPIAAAILMLLAGTAQAQTSLKIGGKIDAGYQFKRIANPDGDLGTLKYQGAPQGGTTTSTQGDGGASTSRITVDASEKINNDAEAYISLDLRFTNIHEGKNATNGGGLNANDKKVMGLRSTTFGQIAWGAYNITNLQIADKPYMTNIKDQEIVKFGVSKPTQSDLTNRVTEVVTPVLTLGPTNMLLKANYAFGDNHKAGTNDISSTGSGDAMTGGFEFVWGDVKEKELTLSAVVGKRVSSAYGSNAGGINVEDGMNVTDTSITYKPRFLPGLKLSTSYYTAKGYNPDANNVAIYGTAYQYKDTNFVVSYNWDKLWQVGVAIAHANDVGSNRNSGESYMLGGSYFLSNSLYVYGAFARSDWERNENITNGKYDGTKAGFKDTLKKIDEKYTRVGIVKEF